MEIESGELPETVRSWFGFTTAWGTFETSAENASLALLNDEAGHTFGQIADFIAAEPAGLFITGEER